MVARPSFSSRVLQSKLSPIEAEVFPYVSASLYAGGQDTVRLIVSDIPETC
jgi:hypothetical protein